MMASSALPVVLPHYAPAWFGYSQQTSRQKLGFENKFSVRRSISSANCSFLEDHTGGGSLSRKESTMSKQRRGMDVRATEPANPSSTPAVKSILCQQCEGNGAVVCSQCKGNGINEVDHFNGRYKAGTVCWLCRGKREMLCGVCNGAGFMGGYLNALED